MRSAYFDHIAATPLHPSVVKAMLPYLGGDNFANPQSLYSAGQVALQAVEEARERVAELINASPSEIYFTSCGSESNNFALKGLTKAMPKNKHHIIISAMEHQSVLNSAESLAKNGFEVTKVPIDFDGVVDPEDVRKAITPSTGLVSIIMASGEVGTIQPIKEIAGICHEHDVLFFTDAVDAVGNIPVDVLDLNVDALSLSGIQFYGPKGSGALFVKKGKRIVPFIDGGIQENGRRAGTENVPAIVGLGEAAALARTEMSIRSDKAIPLRDKLIRELPLRVENVLVTGHQKNRLPHHASFCIEFVEGEAMLLNLDMKGIAASSGSACTSRALKASHVLLAMGIDHALAQGSLVFSIIEDNTEEDVEYLLDAFPPIIERLRQMSPLYPANKEKE